MPALIPVSRDIASRAAKVSWENRRYDEAIRTVVEQFTLRIKPCEEETGGENDKKKSD